MISGFLKRIGQVPSAAVVRSAVCQDSRLLYASNREIRSAREGVVAVVRPDDGRQCTLCGVVTQIPISDAPLTLCCGMLGYVGLCGAMSSRYRVRYVAVCWAMWGYVVAI